VRKSILLALVAALALALGVSSLAAAGQDGATASAKRAHKKGKKKGKGCAKTKGHGKRAHRSATASKKKGKHRGKGCKGGGKRSADWPLRDGTYEGQDGIQLKVEAGGKMAAIVFGGIGGGGPQTCIPVSMELSTESVTSTAKLFKAGGKKVPVFGGNGEISWAIEVSPQLRYKLTVDSSFAFPEQEPCDKPGAHFAGGLEKTD